MTDQEGRPRFNHIQRSALEKVDSEVAQGLRSFVLHRGRRWAVADDVLQKFKLTSGQEVDDNLVLQILRLSVTRLEQKSRMRRPAVPA